MAKTLCDWSKKDILKNWDKLMEITANPTFTCRTCARSANDPRVLCKPKRRQPPKPKT